MDNLGRLIKDNSGYGIILERVYEHEIGKVWDALTDPQKMSVWFTDVKIDPVPGGKITFTFHDEAKTESYGHVVTIQPPRLFEFVWESGDENPDELARWELFEEEGNRTRLRLTYTRLLESYVPGVSAGWHIVLGHFGEYLGGRRDFSEFGAGETEESRIMKDKYNQLFNTQFN